jgi:hypothetical protein
MNTLVNGSRNGQDLSIHFIEANGNSYYPDGVFCADNFSFSQNKTHLSHPNGVVRAQIKRDTPFNM